MIEQLCKPMLTVSEMSWVDFHVGKKNIEEEINNITANRMETREITFHSPHPNINNYLGFINLIVLSGRKQ